MINIHNQIIHLSTTLTIRFVSSSSDAITINPSGRFFPGTTNRLMFVLFSYPSCWRKSSNHKANYFSDSIQSSIFSSTYDLRWPNPSTPEPTLPVHLDQFITQIQTLSMTPKTTINRPRTVLIYPYHYNSEINIHNPEIEKRRGCLTHCMDATPPLPLAASTPSSPRGCDLLQYVCGFVLASFFSSIWQPPSTTDRC